MIRRHIFVAALTVVLVSSVQVRAAVTVRFDPPDETRLLGDVFTIDVVADFTDPILSWGLDMIIDDDVIASLAEPPEIGPLWVPAGGGPQQDGDSLAGLAFPTAHVGQDILLATLTFSADSIGETDLFLMDSNPQDLTEGFGREAGGFDTVAYENGHITVIPEPATAVLLLTGGLVAVWRRRR